MILEKYRHKYALYALYAATCLLVFLWSATRPKEDDSQLTYVLLQPATDNVTASCATADLPASDFSSLIDLSDFHFLLNNFPCNGSRSPFLLVLVHSAPSHATERRVIRDTWGARRELVDAVFLLGDTDSDEMRHLISTENDEHGDIVQGNFVDAYRNLTYKHVMALKWASYFCPEAKYVLKTDDDVFVNTPYLLEYLTHELSPWGARKLLFCTKISDAGVKRSYRSKWRVSPAEYADNIYPPYCMGWSILYSPDVVFELYREAQQSEYFWIDDVHVTGVLAGRINITQTPVGTLAMTESQLTEGTDDVVARIVFGPPNLDINTVQRLWDTALKSKAH